jgi:P-type conjugative transfer protein TrbJ
MRKLLTSLTLAWTLVLTGSAGIPVIDYSNLVQNTTTALKQVAAYAQQVQQYQTQILQYRNQLLNTLGIAPALQTWQQASAVMNQVTGLTSIFRNGSSLQNVLSEFQDVNYWLNTPVASYPNQAAGNVLETQSNAAMFQGLAKQTQLIQQDAATLERLQSTASGAQGQMQALSAANELAALEQQQLLQIRALLVQEQQALAARSATSANEDAMRAAATQRYYGTQLAPEAHQGW